MIDVELSKIRGLLREIKVSQAEEDGGRIVVGSH
jgi:hypothetical protein